MSLRRDLARALTEAGLSVADSRTQVDPDGLPEVAFAFNGWGDQWEESELVTCYSVEDVDDTTESTAVRDHVNAVMAVIEATDFAIPGSPVAGEFTVGRKTIQGATIEVSAAERPGF